MPAVNARFMDRESPAARELAPSVAWAAMSDRVEAAGGVVVRDGQVALVHRPRYDDWTLPKGKLDPGESFEDAALREVEEETGMRAHLVRELPSTNYEVDGQPKIVRYWLMEVDEEGAFVPNEETDELRWVALDQALGLLTYDRDRDVLASVGY
jgi:8-oxo-dGTP pyrophosphatase MutT (NUDIX family)